MTDSRFVNVQARDEFKVAYQDVVDLLRKHAGKGLTTIEMLAIVANLCGKVLAMQDQRKISVSEALVVLHANIETGNQEAVAMMSAPVGKA
jgi:hypothetical protein